MRTSRKRTIAIIVPVAVLALAGIATAAGLTTTSASLGGGSTTVTNNCAIRVSYAATPGSPDVTYQPPAPATSTTSLSPGGYYLTKVTLTPSGTDCNSASFKVTVAKATGAFLSEAVGNFASTAVAVPVTVNAFAQDVGAVYATVTTTTPSTLATTAP